MSKTILIGGAMDSETSYMISQLTRPKEVIEKGYHFHSGGYAGHHVIICKTETGLVNAAISTIVGILNFDPDIIINQGTAGAHVKTLDVGDIVVGEAAVNINCMEMPARAEGKGSDPFSWVFNVRSIPYASDPVSTELFALADYEGGQKVKGILGTGDLWSREVDRINWIHKQKKNLCEDMESIAVYEVCKKWNIPCLGVRIISNNELTGKTVFDESTGETLQKFILKTIEEID